MQPTSHYHHPLFKLIAIPIVIFVCLIFANTNPAIKKAINLATTIQPETFTELYFENHNQLPTTIIRFQIYPYSFTIRNLENKDIEYHYKISGQRNNQTIFEDYYTINIKKGETKTINDTVGPLKNLQTKIIIELIDQNQQISFLMNGTNEMISLTASNQQSPIPKKTIEKSSPMPISNQLYFDTHSALPFFITLNQPFSFKFTIHNGKSKETVFPYEVYLDNNGQISQIDKNQSLLKPNESKTITESYVINTPFNQAKIFVKLVNENNYIYFKLKQY